MDLRRSREPGPRLACCLLFPNGLSPAPHRFISFRRYGLRFPTLRTESRYHDVKLFIITGYLQSSRLALASFCHFMALLPQMPPQGVAVVVMVV